MNGPCSHSPEHREGRGQDARPVPPRAQRRNAPRLLIPASVLLAGFFTAATGADISVTGHWSKIVNRTDLIDGAGSDLPTAIESSPAVATLDITGTADAPWTVRVVMDDIGWPPGASVAVRRNGNENGISGGTSYMPLDATSRIFFSGTGDRTGIQIQIKVEGVSIHTAPSLYNLTITYSVQSP